jgi:hypothetical protein
MLQTLEALVDETGTIRLLEADLMPYGRRVLITVLEDGTSITKDQRPFGLAAGDFRVPDDFDAPLSEDVLLAFEGHLDGQ